MLFSTSQLKAVFRQFLMICGVVLLSRFTKNWGILLLAAYGIFCSLTRKDGKALIVYLLLALLPMINPVVMPRYGHFAMIARLSTSAMTFALILGGTKRRGNHAIPLGGLFIYLVIAVVSSIQGYFPLISFLKIVNFVFFILGIYIGTRNIYRSPKDIQLLRNTFLALSFFIIYGSILTLPFPSVAYFTSIRAIASIYGLEYADTFLANSEGGKTLFTGITVHSQFLGPMAASLFGWLLCDMWLVERKFSWLHIALLAPIPVISYMTRSRAALLSLLVAAMVAVFFVLKKAKLSFKARQRFNALVACAIVVLAASAIVSECRNATITKWIRKTNDLESDDRSLSDAVTGSRQGLIAQNMIDFKRNVMLGSGFQVDANTRTMYKLGRASLFSATIEKGLLPLMVLGETGIIGGLAFLFFLVSFFAICAQKKYYATASLFTVYLSANMAEATFFSPSGGGGTLWICLVAGGFIIDMSGYCPLQPSAFRQVPMNAESDFENSDSEDENRELDLPDGPSILPSSANSTDQPPENV